MRHTLKALLLLGSLALAPTASAQHWHHHHHHHHRAPNPWPWIGGAIIGGAIIETLRPPPPVVMVPGPPPWHWYRHDPPRCGAIYLGNDTWGNPVFGNWCR